MKVRETRTPTKIRRVGLVGFGMIAKNAHCPALRSADIEVSAVFDPAQRSREAASQHVPKVRVYDQLDSLLAGEKSLDALIVCSPPKFHAEAVVAGLNAGLHVLCEKPLTLDNDAFDAIRFAAKTADRCVYSINNWAFSPQWRHLLAVSAAGRLGAIRHAEIRVLRTKPAVSASGDLTGDWRKDPAVSGGGILVDHGWHNLYLMRRLLGCELELEEVSLPHAVVKRPSGAIDEVVTVLLKAPGAPITGTIHLSWRAGERSNSAFAVGEQGTADLRDDFLTVKADGIEETTRFPEKLSDSSAHPEWLAAMWPSFEAECAGRGRGENLAEAEFCLKSIRAAYDG